tara:strand:+ start:1240 stop:1434 length:195 start_codon:yes stop_codon:yes gene_type:complete
MRNFFYDNRDSYEANFRRFYKAKQLEAEMHNYALGPISEKEARSLFRSYYGNKYVKITRIRKYE